MCKVTFALSDVIISSNGGRQSRDEHSDVTKGKLGCLLHSQSCQSMLGVWLHCQGTHCLSTGGCAPELTSHVALLISPSTATRLYQQIGRVLFRDISISTGIVLPLIHCRGQDLVQRRDVMAGLIYILTFPVQIQTPEHRHCVLDEILCYCNLGFLAKTNLIYLRVRPITILSRRSEF